MTVVSNRNGISVISLSTAVRFVSIMSMICNLNIFHDSDIIQLYVGLTRRRRYTIQQL